MEFLKSRRVTSKIAMGLLLGSALLSTSMVNAANYSHCLPYGSYTGSYCSDITKQNTTGNVELACSTSAQVGNAVDANTPGTSTTGNYPCNWGNQKCNVTSNPTATCQATGCSTNACDTYTTTNGGQGACNTAAVINAVGDATGTKCHWTTSTSTCANATGANNAMTCK